MVVHSEGEALHRSLTVTALLMAGLAMPLLGCVHTYQPISGLHGPVVVDTSVENFPDLALEVVCNPGKDLSRGEARRLCEHVGTLFRNQGAQVTTRIGGEPAMEELDTPWEESSETGSLAPEVDLRLELTSRQVHQSHDLVTRVLFALTASLVPAVTEYSFALDVVVQDGSGFLLAADTLEGRIVRRIGVGVWGVNKVMDRFAREPEDIVLDDSAYKELSEDLYGQLSQMVFNAGLQWRVLQQAPGVVRE
jgi:hypothetical protein